jgi:uncharacterized membrane protein YeiH
MWIIDFMSLVGFAISGGTVAARKGFDWFGISSMAFLTAVGGGTIRDVLIGATPSWIVDPSLFYGPLIGVVITIVAYKRVLRLHKTLTLFDALGISFASVVGTAKSLEYGASIPAALILGAVTATMGGLIRDTICNEVPMMLQKEIYATACLFGGLLFAIMIQNDVLEPIASWISICTIFVVRIVAYKFKIALPSVKTPSE